MIANILAKQQPYTVISEDLFLRLGDGIVLPDEGQSVKQLSENAAGGAFDPRDLEEISGEKLGYKATWVPLRYEYYGLPWDITGLKLESLHSKASDIPWVVVINGGSANLYEFFVTPVNQPGWGQYLAQCTNVMLCSIPGNFKYGGWAQPPSERLPQYVLDQDLSDEEVKIRNAVYTMRMVFEGLKRLVTNETQGDVLLVGHSTGGDVAFLGLGDVDMTDRLKGRFLGWGSGGPSNLRREWEQSVGKWESTVKKLSGYPPVWELRPRNGPEYVESGYIGPLNPCGRPGMHDVEVAGRWLSLEARRRPNFKQVLQDVEHHGASELQEKIEAEIKETLCAAAARIKMEEVFKDLFYTNQSPVMGYEKMVWTVGKWDKGHWHKTDIDNARELTIANQFRDKNPKVETKVLVYDLPMTHYGHIEMPQQLAGGLVAAIQWLAQ